MLFGSEPPVELGDGDVPAAVADHAADGFGVGADALGELVDDEVA